MSSIEAASSVASTRSFVRRRASSVAAWSAWGAAAAATLVGMTLGLRGSGPSTLTLELSPLAWAGGVALTLSYATVGLFLRVRVPGNAVGWLFLMIGVASGLGNLAFGYTIAV